MKARLSALAIFSGSFLLFGVQPMLSRTLLPSFGGSASVWTCCLAAYQVLLLVGYGYAHWIAGREVRAARRLHLGLLAVSAVWLLGVARFRGAIIERLGTFSAPSVEILLCVLLFVGLPYVLLASNSTLLQAWIARRERAGGLGHAERRGVYRLYAVSNLGSLLGLLLYPFALEPYVPLGAQWYGLAVSLLACAGLLAAATRGAAGPEGPAAPAATAEARVSPLPEALSRPWLWFALPALSAFLLNAVTMHLSNDVMPVPMLWVLLLTAFLLSYIVGFSGLGERGLYAWAALAAVTLLATAVVDKGDDRWSFVPQILTCVATVFLGGSFLHAWLYRIRPETGQLTRFYLGIAAGGACGGLLASVLAPALFDYVLEFPVALVLVAGFCASLLCLWPRKALRPASALSVCVLAVAVCLVVASTRTFRRQGLFFGRNFYGCLRLVAGNAGQPGGPRQRILQMAHGTTLHGTQSLEEDTRMKPTAYYGERAGGLALLTHGKRASGEPMRVGLIGLGAGTMACYGRTNDVYRFFEINPLVIELATDADIFTFVSGSKAKVECVLGDARKRLEEERRQGGPRYDALVVDAYTGDYVPLHLATREAFELYLDRLAPEGILALHISNWHMDLFPLCKAVAQELNLYATGLVSPGGGLLLEAHWVFLSRAPLKVAAPGVRSVDWRIVRNIELASDEKGSLLSLIELNARGLTVHKLGKPRSP